MHTCVNMHIYVYMHTCVQAPEEARRGVKSPLELELCVSC